ncbi:MAG: GGDEF domain-containing protein [Sulfuricurvum sp.]|uniref:GGDEF domain-containing protein n=1 Tax=Sulfuricurvum sp. TaxID=2025608 RepID=UPI00263783F8|nr:GGDEF domain-containing protein [Sulfuricurvum sp.]MDD2829159.1 GGDEF domain-containing protein [Sulfuricurvum sp.]MDD4950208.1 GGDEF domain-containing protein [Sulfuricurvum sp.]
MKNLYDKHIQVTEEIKKRIGTMKVVLPASYGKLYSHIAQHYALELHPEELLTSEMLDEKMVHHIVTLSNCADNALEAMETQDIAKLQEVIKETQKLKIDMAELTKIIYEDSLTKSYNRKWLEDTFLNNDKLLMRQRGVIAIIDLNKFKIINDNYGHIVGDKVLMHVAKRLQETGGKVVRYGGDEFIVVFDTDENIVDVNTTIELIIDDCENKSFMVEGESFKISFSYGIAEFEVGSEFHLVLNAADKAMYRYKNIKG